MKCSNCGKVITGTPVVERWEFEGETQESFMHKTCADRQARVLAKLRAVQTPLTLHLQPRETEDNP